MALAGSEAVDGPLLALQPMPASKKVTGVQALAVAVRVNVGSVPVVVVVVAVAAFTVRLIDKLEMEALEALANIFRVVKQLALAVALLTERVSLLVMQMEGGMAPMVLVAVLMGEVVASVALVAVLMAEAVVGVALVAVLMEEVVASVALVAVLIAEVVVGVALVAVLMEEVVASVALVAVLMTEAVVGVALGADIMAAMMEVMLMGGAAAAMVLPQVETTSVAVTLSACFCFLWDESEAVATPTRLFCRCLLGDSNRSVDDSAETCSSEGPGCPSLASSIPEAVCGSDCVGCSSDVDLSADVGTGVGVGVMITYGSK
jgi:hypothetical protein